MLFGIITYACLCSLGVRHGTLPYVRRSARKERSEATITLLTYIILGPHFQRMTACGLKTNHYFMTRLGIEPNISGCHTHWSTKPIYFLIISKNRILYF